MIGEIVIKVQCDGCMAEDHKVVAIGRVVAIKHPSEIWGSTDGPYTYAECKIIVSRSDELLKFFYPCVQDGSFQWSEKDKVYFWYI